MSTRSRRFSSYLLLGVLALLVVGLRANYRSARSSSTSEPRWVPASARLARDAASRPRPAGRRPGAGTADVKVEVALPDPPAAREPSRDSKETSEGEEPEERSEAEKQETPEPRPDGAKKNKKKDKDGDELFSPGLVPRIAITIEREGWRALQRDPRSYVEARVEADGKVYERVGVHLKGAAGSFRPIDSRPALTLKFNKYVEGQGFHSLRKLHLNNSVQDGTYLNELLAGELFIAAGVPATRATHAIVTLNGRKLGLYVLKEAFDKRFLRRHFSDDSGNLYDGGFCQDIYTRLENDTHRESTDWTDLRNLMRAAQERDPAKRWERLEEVLDMDRFLSFMAIEVLLWDWDGYAMKPNNYRVYHDPTSNRMVFFPHGMDQLLEMPDGSITPPMGGLVARAIMEVPIGRARYLERLEALSTKLFQPDAIAGRMAEVKARLAPAAAEVNSRLARELEWGMENLGTRIRDRARSVERQLSREAIRPMDFDTDGVARLDRQRWFVEKDFGGVEVREAQGPNGEPQLVVDSHGNECRGSWRCQVLLDRGAYRFEARVRTEGVVPLSDQKGAGAGLRLGGAKTPRANQASGDSGWQTLSHDFEVEGALEDTELLCELRATEGRAWFDRGSIRLVRQKLPAKEVQER